MSDDYILLRKKLDEIPVDITLLDKGELSRYDRLIDPSKKLEFLAGRCFLKREIATMVDKAPEKIQISLSENGKPYIESAGSDVYRMKFPHFNLSHDEGTIVIVFSKFPVGVDLEEKRVLSADTLRPFFSSRELDILNNMDGNEQQRSLLHLFTMKEAFIKATDKKWGLDVISFDWLQNSWQLQQPSVNCEFHLVENEEFTTSICLVTGE